MPVSAATQQDMQKDIDSLTRAFDEQIESLQTSSYEYERKYETTDLKNLSQKECEAQIDKMFKNGVPDEYMEDYNNYVKTLKNLRVETEWYGNEAFTSSGKAIVCYNTHKTLNECINAEAEIPGLSRYMTKDNVKKIQCGKKTVLTPKSLFMVEW